MFLSLRACFNTFSDIFFDSSWTQSPFRWYQTYIFVSLPLVESEECIAEYVRLCRVSVNLLVIQRFNSYRGCICHLVISDIFDYNNH